MGGAGVSKKMQQIPERDWKYMRSVQSKLLETLCSRINSEASRIAADPSLSEHERFLALNNHMQAGKEIVADCFDDWKRSNIGIKMLMLERHALLTGEHVSRLSPETQNWLKAV